MRVVVDLNRCQGYAQCAFLAPDVFTMHGDEALVYNPRAEDEHREAVARAAAACPVQAITVEGLIGPDGPEGPRGSAPEACDRAREGLGRAQESFHGQ